MWVHAYLCVCVCVCVVWVVVSSLGVPAFTQYILHKIWEVSACVGARIPVEVARKPLVCAHAHLCVWGGMLSLGAALCNARHVK